MTAEQREASLRAAIAEVEQRVMREMHDQEMYERDSVRKRLAAEAEVQSKIEVRTDVCVRTCACVFVCVRV